MNKKVYIICVVLLLIFSFGTAWLISKNVYSKKDPIIIVKEDKSVVDSLNNIIEFNESIIEKLKDSIIVVEKVKIIKEIEKINELPIDSGIMLAKDNFLVYGENSNILDTLPMLFEYNNDTLAIFSESNVKDINIISSKLGFQYEINKMQSEIIDSDSIMLDLKTKIIEEKDIILRNQEIAFDNNMKALESQLKKEKVKKTAWVIGGITVSAAFVTSLLLKNK